MKYYFAKIFKLVGVTIFFTLAGCAGHVKYLETALVAKNDIDLQNLKIKRLGPTTGSSCQHRVLFFPITRHPKIQAAVEDAIDKIDGSTFLLDAEIEKQTIFAIFYASSCIKVKGTAAVIEK